MSKSAAKAGLKIMKRILLMPLFQSGDDLLIANRKKAKTLKTKRNNTQHVSIHQITG